jgi:hypothetical protein
MYSSPQAVTVARSEMEAQELSRRAILGGAVASLVGGGFAKADGTCPAQGFYQPLGQAICNALQIAAQTNSEWCWAATTSIRVS